MGPLPSPKRAWLAAAAWLARAPSSAGASPLAHDSSLTGLVGSSFGIPGRAYEFDYLVVGGGNAGLTVAARLAEDPSLSVGVVEAGGFYELTNGNLSEIPAFANWFTGKDADDWHPGIDWGFVTEPQAALRGLRAHYARGRTLGGSTARNYMTYHVAPRGANDQMAARTQSRAYAVDAVFPYFTRSQHFTPPAGGTYARFANATPAYDAARLGTGGPLSVLYPKFAHAFGSWAARGFEAALGLRAQAGFESGALVGAYAYPLATIRHHDNTRESAETAFLRPRLGARPANLVTFVNTLAKRVLFDGRKRAVGVRVDTGGLAYTLRARREVIVSAGAFQSPQLLMVSGVGPADVLREHGIALVHESPGVGQNLKDHVLFGTAYRVNLVTGSAFGNPDRLAEFEEQYARGNGPMTNPGIDILGWERLPRDSLTNATIATLAATFPPDWPEVEYLPNGGFFGNASNFQKLQPADDYQYASVIASLVATLSTGNVTLASADTADAPRINPNWLSHPADREQAIAAFKRTRAVWAAPALDAVRIGPEYFPGAHVADDAAIWRHIQDTVSTVFHAACTCRMGADGDPAAVLDAHARVRGVSALRVVDASSLPVLPPGHPMATIYALAEKIVDDIRNGN